MGHRRCISNKNCSGAFEVSRIVMVSSGRQSMRHADADGSGPAARLVEIRAKLTYRDKQILLDDEIVRDQRGKWGAWWGASMLASKKKHLKVRALIHKTPPHTVIYQLIYIQLEWPYSMVAYTKPSGQYLILLITLTIL